MPGQLEDLVVVGAGPAGLCAAWSAMQRGWRTLVIDGAANIGGVWARVRPDMRCLSPRRRDLFPDGSYPLGDDPRASAAEVLAAIEQFAARLQPRLKLQCAAVGIAPQAEGLAVHTANGSIVARRVIVATGEYGRPRAAELPGSFEGVLQHSSRFNPKTLRGGERIVVIGAGNSGAEAAQLAAARGAIVFLAARRPLGRAPREAAGRLDDLFYWLSGLPIDRLPLRGGCRSTTPVINPQFYAAVDQGAIEVVGAATGFFAQGVEIDGGLRLACDRVVLATGFRRDTAWLGSAVQTAEDGTPRHRAGISTDLPGLGFVGIPCLRTWRSGFLRGFAADAGAVVSALQ